MAASAYRSLEPVLQERLAILRAQRAEEAPRVAQALRVAARRIGRAWGGGVALLLSIASFLVALAALPASGDVALVPHAWATRLLVAALPVGLLVSRFVALLALPHLEAKLAAPPELTGDIVADLSRIGAASPAREGRAEAAGWERASVALPMAAFSMTAPLLIHLAVWLSLSAPSGALGEHPGADFGEWISWSAALVGHAHLAVLVGSVRWAMGLPSCRTTELGRDLYKHWGGTLLVATLLACLPGIIALGLPPLLVGMTGLAFMPALYALMARRVAGERATLDAI